MDFTLVKNFMGELATHLPLEIIRAEQSGDQPTKPFASYKVLSKNNGDYREWREIEIVDPTKYSDEFFRKEEFMISLSFIGDDISNLYTLADKSFDFLNILSRDKKRELNIRLEILNTITDRSIYLDPVYEYKVGFDFKIKSMGSLTRVIDSVDIDLTVDEIEMNFE